jgi:hypothetical protein
MADLAVQQSVVCDLCSLIPLLEKVSDPGLSALGVNVPHPIDFHWSAFGLCGLLTAGDDPVDGAIQMWPKIHSAQQWLCRNEPQLCWKALEKFHSVHGAFRSAGYAQPDIRIAVTPILGQVFSDTLRTLGENQPVEVRAVSDDLPCFGSPQVGSFVEKVRHGACENPQSATDLLSLTIPFGWLGPINGPHRAIERLTPSQLHQAIDVAVLALGGDLVASPPEVHCVIGPTDP